MSLHDLWDHELLKQIEDELSTEESPANSETIVASLKSSLDNNPQFARKVTNLARPSVESVDEVRSYAALIATETSTKTTCNYAYVNEDDIFIKKNDAISEEYITSRSQVVYKQLFRAGIRLAEFIDEMADRYEAKKGAQRQVRLRAENEAILKRLKTSVELSENPFATLDFDFEPDEVCRRSQKLIQELTSASSTTVSSSDTRESSLVSEIRQNSPTKDSESDEALLDRLVEENKRASLGIESISLARTAATDDSAAEHSVDVVSYESLEYGGVDLSKLVLIKRRGQYFVTAIHLVTAKYIPVSFGIFKVQFEGNNRQPSTRDYRERVSTEDDKLQRPITIGFDTEVFGKRQITREMVTRSLMQLRGMKMSKGRGDLPEYLDPISLSSGGTGAGTSAHVEGLGTFEKVGRGIPALTGMSEDPCGISTCVQGEDAKLNASLHRAYQERYLAILAAERQMVGPGTPYATIEEKWEKDFSKNLKSIVVYGFKRVHAYLHEDTLHNPEPNGHMRFHQFSFHDLPPSGDGLMDAESEYTVLVDTNIFTGELTPKILFALGLAQRISSKLSDEMIFVRPSLYKEILDINTILYDEDPERMSRLEVVSQFFSFPGNEEESFYVYEYQLRRNPSEYKVDPNVVLVRQDNNHTSETATMASGSATTTRSVRGGGAGRVEKKGDKKKVGKN